MHDHRVLERNVEALPLGPDNPTGNAFVMRDTPLLKLLSGEVRTAFLSNS